MVERQEFSLNAGELGILSTEEVIDAGENFLSSDPDNLTLFKKPSRKKKEEEDDEEEEVEKKKKKVQEPKEVVVTSNEINEDDAFSAISEEDEEEDEEPIEKKPKKLEGQKLPEKKVEEEAVEADTTEGAEEEGPSVYSTIAKELVTHGVFTLDEDEEEVEIDSPEDLLQRFQYEGQKHATNVLNKFLGRFGDDYRDMFDNVFVKGVDPLEYLNRYARVESVQNMDLTDEANQERVVRELYRAEGRSAEYIEKKLTQHRNYGDLADEATEAQKILIQREDQANKKAAADKEAFEQRKQMIKNEYVNNVTRILTTKMKDKEFDGIPVDKGFADRTFLYLTQERYETKDRQVLTEFDKDLLDLSRPENHEMKVKLGMLMQLLREDPTLSKLAKKAVSKETNQLFQGLKKAAMKTGDQPKKQTESKSWFQS
jgi:hypothetical protein